MPIIVGAPRSGTTLLRFMLDVHPALAIPPETGFLAPLAMQSDSISPVDFYRILTTYPQDLPGWEDFGIDRRVFWAHLGQINPFSAAEGVREFYRLYAARHGKRRYGDKTPMYCQHMRSIEALLPEAHFIHIIRDGRDVAGSLQKMWFAPTRDIGGLAGFWSDLVRRTREAAASTRQYMEVRYESLVYDPEPVLRSICDFIQLEFSPRMLRYWEHTPERLREHRARRGSDGEVVITHEGRLQQQRLTMEPPQKSRTFAWRREMSPADQLEFHRVAGDTLDDLGYQ